MKKYFKLLIYFLFCIFLVTGCNNIEKVKTITIEGKIELYVGESYNYIAIFDVEGYDNSNIDWSTSDETKAKIDKAGNLIALEKCENVEIIATLKEDKNVFAKHSISIVDKKIDLGGYTIKMGYNRFYEKSFKDVNRTKNEEYGKILEETISIIEEKYNCKIEYSQMPDGNNMSFEKYDVTMDKLSGIIKDKSLDYDFIMLVDGYIRDFAAEDLIVPININSNSTEDYILDIFAIQDIIDLQHLNLVYNIDMLEELGITEEPAKLFLDGDWTYTEFLNYCMNLQSKLDEMNKNSDAKVYSILGHYSTLWAGLVGSSQMELIDTSNYQVNLKNPRFENAAKLVKNIFDNGLADPNKKDPFLYMADYDEEYVFSIVPYEYLYRFDNLQDINGNKIKFGYVPFPRPDDANFDEYKVGIPSTPWLWCMPNGRDTVYDSYGYDCSKENIIKVIQEMLTLVSQVYKENNEKEEANRFSEGHSSEAYKYIQELINSGKTYKDFIYYSDYYDMYSGNSEDDSITIGLSNYFENQVSWEEAMEKASQTLQDKLNIDKEISE